MNAGVAFDVMVVGAGPAGSATARQLARFGHRVLLVERRPFPRPHVGESLSPGVAVHLDTLGVTLTRFRPVRETLLRWRGDPELVVSEQPSMVVDRADFDSLLLDAARDAGAEVAQPVTVEQIDDRGERWRAALSDGREVTARYVIDAAGRAGFLRRPRRPTAPRLIAWHTRSRPAHPPEQTVVEALEDGWLWGTALPDGSFSSMFFTGGGDGRRLAEHAAEATPFVCEDLIDARSLAVGEAAFAIDPISSSGVQAALGSAIAAAIVVNTILLRPGDTDAAIRFYAAHVARTSARHVRWAAEAYADAAPTRRAEARRSTFWSERAAAALPPALDEQIASGPVIRGNFVT